MTTRPRITLADIDRAVSEHPPIDDRAVHRIELDRIQASPRNPRQDFGILDELAASLDTHGLLQPILVRPAQADMYEVIAGHRRLAAARQLGWATIACVVRPAEPDEAFILTLVENLQRDDLSPKEEAAGLETLLRERNWSVRQVARAVQRSHAYVSKRLRVFDDPLLAPAVLSNRMPVSFANELLTLGPDDRRVLVDELTTAETPWTRAELNRAIREVKQPHLGARPRNFLEQAHTFRNVLKPLQPHHLKDADRAALNGVRREIDRLSPRADDQEDAELTAAEIRDFRRRLALMMPRDFTEAKANELRLLFRAGLEQGKAYSRRRRAVVEGRGDKPIIPTLTASGRVFINELVEEETEDEMDAEPEEDGIIETPGMLVLDSSGQR